MSKALPKKRGMSCADALKAKRHTKRCTYDPTLVKGIVLSEKENAREVSLPYAKRAGVTV